MHESPVLDCIFGCKESKDRLDHYMECPILWSVLHEAFEGDFTPCNIARLNFAHPSPSKLVLISASFEIYHALKIGLRNSVEEALASHRLAEICRIAAKLAGECRATHRDLFPESRGGPNATQPHMSQVHDMHTHSSNVGALRTHPLGLRERESSPHTHPSTPSVLVHGGSLSLNTVVGSPAVVSPS